MSKFVLFFFYMEVSVTCVADALNCLSAVLYFVKLFVKFFNFYILFNGVVNLATVNGPVQYDLWPCYRT